MTPKIILKLVIIIIFLGGCVNFKDLENQRSIALDKVYQCSDPKPGFNFFQVIKNDGETVVAQIGADLLKANKLTYSDISYVISYNKLKLNSGKLGQDLQIILNLTDLKNKFPTVSSGAYTISLFSGFLNKKEIWKQDVLAVMKSEAVVPPEQSDDLKAAVIKYAPVISMNSAEAYHPASIEYLLNDLDNNANLDLEEVVLAGTLGLPQKDQTIVFKDLQSVLPSYGDNRLVIKFKKDHATKLKDKRGIGYETVYSSVFQKEIKGEQFIFINYHFLYTFDYKNGTPENPPQASHTFDRESITVILKRSDEKNHPLYPRQVIFGAHLPNQRIQYLDGTLDSQGQKNQQTWAGGRLIVNWSDIIKIGSHPVAMAARGSHGLYPLPGEYNVKIIGEPTALKEPVGGNQLLFPKDNDLQVSTAAFNKANKAATYFGYELKDLHLEDIVSLCGHPSRQLIFSGSFVDVLGQQNATFPPFTDREANYQNYVDVMYEGDEDNGAFASDKFKNSPSRAAAQDLIQGLILIGQ